MSFLRRLFWLSAIYNFRITARYILGMDILLLLYHTFNDLKNSQSDNKVISAIKPALELLKSRFPNAMILIGEVLPHPSDEQMNKRISYYQLNTPV